MLHRQLCSTKGPHDERGDTWDAQSKRSPLLVEGVRAYPSRGKHKFSSLIVSNSVDSHASQPILDVHWVKAEVKEGIAFPAGSS